MTASWIDRLYCLAYRFDRLGVTADIAAMTTLEAWDLYRYLSRLASE